MPKEIKKSLLIEKASLVVSNMKDLLRQFDDFDKEFMEDYDFTRVVRFGLDGKLMSAKEQAERPMYRFCPINKEPKLNPETLHNKLLELIDKLDEVDNPYSKGHRLN